MLHRNLSPILFAALAGCGLNSVESTRSDVQSVNSPIHTLVLSTMNGSIDVQPHDSPGVELDIAYKAYGATVEEAKQNCEALSCDISEDGGVLTAKLIRPSGQRSPSVSFQVKCPADCELQLDTSNGSVHVQDIHAGVDVNTSNGRVECNRLRGPLSVNTSNGRISAEDCAGSITLQTSNGRVSWSGQLTGSNNTIDTSNGKVTVAIPEDSSTELDVSTSNGKIDCDMPNLKIVSDKNSLQTVVGKSEDGVSKVKLKVHTSNGSVSIEPWAGTAQSLPAEAESE